MYSGIFKYRVYKKDITHYRIEMWNGTEWKPACEDFPDQLILLNCKFVVDKDLQKLCKENNLQGDAAPVHAWIECTAYIKDKTLAFQRKVFYNPFRVEEFVDRETMKPVSFANSVAINGNTLFYNI